MVDRGKSVVHVEALLSELVVNADRKSAHVTTDAVRMAEQREKIMSEVDGIEPEDLDGSSRRPVGILNQDDLAVEFHREFMEALEHNPDRPGLKITPEELEEERIKHGVKLRKRR